MLRQALLFASRRLVVFIGFRKCKSHLLMSYRKARQNIRETWPENDESYISGYTIPIYRRSSALMLLFNYNKSIAASAQVLVAHSSIVYIDPFLVIVYKYSRGLDFGLAFGGL
ncbi:hypothetical protein N7G274_001179 [Stereocaulon virgatum]|uniref:Uncharacterized protein n=1 Tax=Stereocaulon virgatum TaxID=373712 RepID=A0ABR4APH0_9LECA